MTCFNAFATFHALKFRVQLLKRVANFLLLDFPLLRAQYPIQLLNRRQLDIDPAIIPLFRQKSCNIDLIVISTLTGTRATELKIALMVWAAHPELIVLRVITNQAVRKHERTLMRTHLLRAVVLALDLEDSELSVTTLHCLTIPCVYVLE